MKPHLFFKKKRRPQTMLTAYDAPTAQMLESEGIDFILVGDSVGMVLLGYDSTVPVTMDEMIHHAKAVRRGAKKTFIIGDLPLKGVEKGPGQALESARRFVREAGCQAVKLEWNARCLETTRLLVQNSIPVMGHVGLTPQSALREGGFKVRAQKAEEAEALLQKAMAFQSAGSFSILIECVPSPVAKIVTERLRIPTFGIGAGPYCDGQVLVFHDVVGSFKKFKPRFVKTYANTDGVMRKAGARFIKDVHSGRFPRKKNSFDMKEKERARFLRGVGAL
jgi:3-methyl-2-oxobutanoate hydroxymethyltransferase